MIYWFIILTLVLQAGGLLLYYSGARKMRQYRVAEILRESRQALETKSISYNEYRQYGLPVDEISINDKIFDIKSVKINDDKVELLVLHDTEEENIIGSIMRLLGNPDTQGDIPGPIIELLKAAYLLPGAQQIAWRQCTQQPDYYTMAEVILSTTRAIRPRPPRNI